MTFDGRVEARINVPAGVSVSATTDLGTSTVTIPQGSYFWTSAGGQTGLIATIAAQLNAFAPPSGYPRTASATNAALGYGTWTSGAGWLCDESSSPLGPTFGSPSLSTLVGAPSFGSTVGPRGGSDKAVTFGATDRLSGGNVFDVGSTDDLAIAGVFRLSSVSGFNVLVGKGNAGDAGNFVIFTSGNQLFFRVTSASVHTDISIAFTDANDWCAIVAAVDRATGMARIAYRSLSNASISGSSALTAVSGSFSDANNFLLGANTTYAPNDAVLDVAGLYVVTGSGVAAGVPANAATATASFAAAINAAWTASLSTGATGTGQITFGLTSGAIPPAWAIAWTSTALRDVAGFAADVWSGYPRSAAETASTIGYATWSAGWLCDEGSGSLSPTYGSTTLSPTGSITYGINGPRGGTDRAIAFGAGNNYVDGGNVYDAGASDDLAVAWVGLVTGALTNNSTVLSKVSAAFGNGWAISPSSTTNTLWLFAGPGVSFGAQASVASLVGEPHVGIATWDRSTGKMRIGLRGLATGTASISAEASISGSFSNAASFRAGASAWTATAEPNVQLDAFYVAVGAGVANGLSANMATALANFAAMVGSRTGAKQARGLWIPDAPLTLDGDPRRAPKVSDLRTTTSPTGAVYGLVGNVFYRHKNVAWSHVAAGLVWESSAVLANGSWETFFTDTQLALGPTTWFSPASPVQVYDHTGRVVGSDLNSGAGPTGGWQMTGVSTTEERRVDRGGWTGLWAVELPELVSSG